MNTLLGQGIICVTDISPFSLSLNGKGIQCWGHWQSQGHNCNVVLQHWPVTFNTISSQVSHYSLCQLLDHPYIAQITLWISNPDQMSPVVKDLSANSLTKWLHTSQDKFIGYAPLAVHRARLIYQASTRHQMKNVKLIPALIQQQTSIQAWGHKNGLYSEDNDLLTRIDSLAIDQGPYHTLRTWISLGPEKLEQHLGPGYVEQSWGQFVQCYGLSINDANRLAACSATTSPDKILTALARDWLWQVKQAGLLSGLMREEYVELNS